MACETPLNVYVVGADEAHPDAPTEGVVDASVNKYPVTPTLSVAVSVVMETDSAVDVAGIVNAVTVGAKVSVGTETVIENAGSDAVPVLLVALITMLL